MLTILLYREAYCCESDYTKMKSSFKLLLLTSKCKHGNLYIISYIINYKYGNPIYTNKNKNLFMIIVQVLA